jgi:hypothetical protein
MKKYFYLLLTFTLFWIFIIYYLSFVPRLASHNSISSDITPYFYIYTFDDTEPLSTKNFTKFSQKNMLADLTFEQQAFKNSLKVFLASNWVKFVQYNEKHFCLIKTNKEELTLYFEYCNNYLFKRSIELATTTISKSYLFTMDSDFVFKINSNELKELFNEQDSSYLNYDTNINTQ